MSAIMKDLSSTADVSPQFLEAAFLVGHAPHRALKSDPRISYLLYIPKKHYNPDPLTLQSGPPNLPLLVHIHGTGRSLDAARRALVPFADSTPFAVLAPLFPAALDGPWDLDSYKKMLSATLRSATLRSAIQLNLSECVAHSRGIATRSINPDDDLLRIKTWLGCFAVSTSLSADLSLPPSMGPLAHLEADIRKYLGSRLHSTFMHQLDIQQHAVRAATLLKSTDPNSLQNSIIELLEQELEAINDVVSVTSDSFHSRLNILAAKLRLYAVPLLSWRPPDTTRHDADNISKVLQQKGFHTATLIISMFEKPMNGANDTTNSPTGERNEDNNFGVTVPPKHYFTVLAMAGMYLLHLLPRTVSASDKELACNSVRQVCGLFTRWSRHSMDEHARTARMLAFLLRHVEDGDASSFTQVQDAQQHIGIIGRGLVIAEKLRAALPGRAAGSSHQSQYTEAATRSTMDEPIALDESELFVSDDLSDWFGWLPGGEDFLRTFQTFPDID